MGRRAGQSTGCPRRDWAEALLNEKRLREDGILAPGPIRQMWRQHVSGQRRWHYHLCDVLMLHCCQDTAVNTQAGGRIRIVKV